MEIGFFGKLSFRGDVGINYIVSCLIEIKGDGYVFFNFEDLKKLPHMLVFDFSHSCHVICNMLSFPEYVFIFRFS